MERCHLPTEADTPPENLSVPQVCTMIRALVKECLGLDVSVSSGEDGVIHIDTSMAMWRDCIGWNLGMVPSKNPLELFPQIIKNLSTKRVANWMTTNYYCVS
jgi:hypothetical protein